MRHANVEEHEVGARLADEREHLRPGLRLADDLESAVGLERALDPVEDEAMVVGDHDAHGGQCRTGLRCRLATPPTAARPRAYPQSEMTRAMPSRRWIVVVAGLASAIACRSPRRDSGSGVEPVAGEVVVNEAVAERSESRLAGVVAALDRAFPLLWIGLYLLLPMSGWASVMFAWWFDQKRDLDALRSRDRDGQCGRDRTQRDRPRLHRRCRARSTRSSA